MGNLPAALCAALLFAATAAAAALAVEGVDFGGVKDFVSTGAARIEETYNRRRLVRQAKRHAKAVRLKMTFIEKAELYFIERSNIRKYLPFFNFYLLVFIAMALFGLSLAPVYRVVYSVPAAVLACAMVSSAPFLALEIWARANAENVRRKLADFVSVLNRWCAVKEDVVYAFEKSLTSGIGEPLKTYARDFVVQVKRGLDVQEAFEILAMKVDSAQFKDFVLNISENMKHSGDLRKLLSKLEDEYYRLEEEYSRRKISTYKDRIMMYSAMFAALAVGFLLLKSNRRVMDFYLGTPGGQLLMALFSLLFFMGFLMSLRINKFKY